MLKGSKHSEGTKQKNRLSHLGQIPWNKGKVLSEEHKERLSLAKEGYIPWIKGKSKEDYPQLARTEEAKRKISLRMMGHEVTKGAREKSRISNLGKTQTDETRQKQRLNMLKLWQAPEYVQMQMKVRNVQPNKLELMFDNILHELFPGEWKFVGDGQFILGGKCPDFMNINGKKQIIELFGDYWHKDENPQDRIDVFAKYGFATLVIWEHEIRNAPKSVRDKVRSFSEVYYEYSL